MSRVHGFVLGMVCFGIVGGACEPPKPATDVLKPVSTADDCPSGLHFEAGQGCVPDAAPVKHTDVERTEPVTGPATSGAAPANPAPPPTSHEGMVLVPAGSFDMGSNNDATEKPIHRVSVSAFWMDVTEVTVAAYAACVKAGGCQPAPTTVDWPGITDEYRRLSAFCNGNRDDRQNHPINCVDWNHATAFCQWAGKRLPTEEEWEYAARGTDGRTYPWGNEKPNAQLLNACGSECRSAAKALLGLDWPTMYSGNDGWSATAPVGSFPADKSPFGLFDMAGNVEEWTSSGWSDDYSKNRGSTRFVLRGGGWGVTVANAVRASYRNWSDVGGRYVYIGIRCAQ